MKMFGRWISRLPAVSILLFLLLIAFSSASAAEDEPACAKPYVAGMEAYDKGDYKTALEHLSTALDCVMKEAGGKDSADSAFVLKTIAATYRAMRENEKALEYYNRALEIRRKIYGDNHPEVAAIYNNIGVVYTAMGDATKAHDYFIRALKNYNSLPDKSPADVALTYDNLGSIDEMSGNFRRSADYYQRALDIRLAATDTQPLVLADSYDSLGRAHIALGEFVLTRELLLKELEIRIRETGPDRLEVAAIYNSIGYTYDSLGDFSAAMEYYNKALAIYAKTNTGDSAQAAKTLTNIGYILTLQGDYEHALTNYQKSLEIDLKEYGESNSVVGKDYNNIGYIYSVQGDIYRALDFYQKALSVKIKSLGEDNVDLSNNYDNIGDAYIHAGDFGKAKANYQRALDLRLKAYGENHPDTALSFNNVGSIYEFEGNLDKAIEYYEMALDIWVKTLGENHASVGGVYNNLAEAYGKKGDFKRAIEYYKKSVEVKTKAFGPEHPDVAFSLINLGSFYADLGDNEAALASYRSALAAVCGNKKDPLPEDCRPEDITVNGFFYLAAEYEIAGRLEDSATAYGRAADMLDLLRSNIQSEESKKLFGKQFYEMFPEGVGVYAALAKKSGDNAQLEKAFLYAERGIGRVFLEMLGRSQAVVRGGLPDKVIAEGVTLNARLKAAQDAVDREIRKPVSEQNPQSRGAALTELQGSRKALDDYEKRLLDTSPAYADLMHPRPRPLSEIRKTVIGKDEAALEYIIGLDASWLLMITQDSIRVVKFPPRKEIEQKVEAFRNLLKSPQTDETQLRASAAALYDILVAPVQDDLAKIQSLVIVPTGELYFLPFESLVMPVEGQPQYLLFRYNIRYAPSLNVLYLTAQAAAGGAAEPGAWLGFGDPVYQSQCDDRARGREFSTGTVAMVAGYTRAMTDGVDARGGLWCRLPGTEKEVVTIGDMFGLREGDASMRLGFNADEKDFKRFAPTGYKYIHIASHGTLGEGGAREPAVVLSLVDNPPGEDGFLTMTEVFNMKIPSDMVVLSACKTGQGMMEQGEGVAGMSRAFLYAGAKSLVVSLWSVADVETMQLMKDFYARMEKENAPRADALVTAKRDMASKGKHPFYWAPFVFIGLR